MIEPGLNISEDESVQAAVRYRWPSAYWQHPDRSPFWIGGCPYRDKATKFRAVRLFIPFDRSAYLTSVGFERFTGLTSPTSTSASCRPIDTPRTW
jgi:hypothetical protein